MHFRGSHFLCYNEGTMNNAMKGQDTFLIENENSERNFSELHQLSTDRLQI
jgi:hypothetical protein